MPPKPPVPQEYNSTGVEYHTIPSFTFVNGTTLHDLRVAYRSFNPSSTAGTVLIPTCFGGHINTTLTFTNTPNDALAPYHVVVAAMLGNGESASPSNKPFFPEPGQLHYEDVIRAHYQLLTAGLGVKQLAAVVGFSMGGQQAYHWGVMYPDFVQRVVGICTSARTSPHNYAFLEGPIIALTASIDYIAWKQMQAKVAREGEGAVGPNLRDVRPKQGIAGFSRAYAAWLTSAAWFRQRHWRDTLGFDCVEKWLQFTESNRENWGADDLLVLARMWQMGDIGRTAKEEVTVLGGGTGNDDDLQQALQNIKAKVLLMPCRTDQYFPPEDNEEEMKYLKNGRLEVIESVWGHTAGGGLNPADITFMNEKIKQLMGEDGADEKKNTQEQLPLRQKS